MADNFADVVGSPLAERHHRLWRWFESLEDGVRPRPRVEVWPRGGAKSSTAELACAYLSTRMTRRFVLYVSETQEQADLHVQAIGYHIQRVKRISSYMLVGGTERWRRNQVRTRDDFFVASYGLDSGMRGVKMKRFRPDLIIFDDIDSQSDSSRTVEKKIEAITRAILPVGSSRCAVLFLQNLVHQDGVVSRLVDGRARFLLDREVVDVEPAVRGLVVDVVPEPGLPLTGATPVLQTTGGPPVPPLPLTGGTPVLQTTGGPPVPPLPQPNRYRIVAGEPTWAGQPLDVCEEQINTWGLQAFLREAQHEVRDVGGYFFNGDRFQIVEEAPKLAKVCIAFDLAATEGSGDYTTAVWLGITSTGIVYVLHVVREQLGSDRVRKLILDQAEKAHRLFSNYVIRIPQDPGQAGRAQADQLRRLLASYRVRIAPVTGSKAVRAQGWAEKVNVGNVRLLKAEWNRTFIEEHASFREDLSHLSDDQVDAAADAFNEVAEATEAQVYSSVKVNPEWERNL